MAEVDRLPPVPVNDAWAANDELNKPMVVPSRRSSMMSMTFPGPNGDNNPSRTKGRRKRRNDNKSLTVKSRMSILPAINIQKVQEATQRVRERKPMPRIIPVQRSPFSRKAKKPVRKSEDDGLALPAVVEGAYDSEYSETDSDGSDNFQMDELKAEDQAIDMSKFVEFENEDEGEPSAAWSLTEVSMARFDEDGETLISSKEEAGDMGYPKPNRKVSIAEGDGNKGSWKVAQQLFTGDEGKQNIQRVKRALYKEGEANTHAHLPSLKWEKKNLSPIAKCAFSFNPVCCDAQAAEAAHIAAREVMLAAEKSLGELKGLPRDPVLMVNFQKHIREMHVQRPMFKAPFLMNDRISRGVVYDEPEPEPEPEPEVVKVIWTLPGSVFGRRKNEADCRNFLDSNKVFVRRLKRDWDNVVCKEAFAKALTRSMRKNPKYADGLEIDVAETLQNVFDVFKDRYILICQIYFYYSVTGGKVGESAFSMTINQWNKIVKDCKLVDPKSKHCKQADIDMAFTITNYEEDGNDDLNDANDDLALMRFEFVEILTRVAILKYGAGQSVWEPSDALIMLLEENIFNNMPTELDKAPNVFRNERLYTEEVDMGSSLLTKLKILGRWPRDVPIREVEQGGVRSEHAGMRPLARDAVKYMGMEHFLRFCDAQPRPGTRSLPNAARHPPPPNSPGTRPACPALAASKCGPALAASKCGPALAASKCGPALAASKFGPALAASTCGPALAASKCGPAPAASKCGPALAASKCGPALAASSGIHATLEHPRIFMSYEMQPGISWSTISDTWPVRLTNNITRVSQREAKLIFVWSQMCYVDEVKNRLRVIGITFTDFLEAVARLADLISPPSPEDLAAYFHETNEQETSFPTAEYYGTVPETYAIDTARESAELGVPKTRPLHDKLEQIMEMVRENLLESWGCKSVPELTSKLNSLTVTLGGTVLPADDMNQFTDKDRD
ncbi:hypothetical protein CYMTET_49742 [Cymbomonas tetramitiformis]|uniref:Uncharacterized protein n=1 Tax=Cymbomonas tetramitiformis TaxID=36881 RepID=A0AAE0EU86_9CHLO|nr:hypothetical protein CYMTET_49742 [Cymbomonas tetramitiformis]